VVEFGPWGKGQWAISGITAREEGFLPRKQGCFNLPFDLATSTITVMMVPTANKIEIAAHKQMT
jgi:hypothetical protein